jgi:cytochrome c peroxidase
MIILAVGCLAAFGAFMSSSGVSAKTSSAQSASAQPVYFPYPPGVIPSDFETETNRVDGEIDRLEQEALGQFSKLNTADFGTSKRQFELLGKIEIYDKNLSVNRNMACTFCHMPYTGFSGPISSFNATTVSYPGSVRWRFGKRQPTPYTYSPYFPKLEFNVEQANFYGGNFWDLRASGFRTQSPDAEQAQGPPHDSQEMGLPDPACVVFRIATGSYANIFKTVWGAQAFDIRFPGDTEQICSTPAGDVPGNPSNPLSLSAVDRGRANATYDQYALSVTAYEQSDDISPFSSKFDGFLAGDKKFNLTADEKEGYDIFRGKGNCNSCHLDGRSTAPTPPPPNGTDTSAVDTGVAASVAPLFTDFTSANLGLPKNVAIPFYFENKPDAFGFVPNPLGFGFTDLGVRLFLDSSPFSGPNPDNTWAAIGKTGKFDGFFQTATARNVDMRPFPGFVRSYMHNGYLKSLKEVVHFYNTRDTLGAPCSGPNDPRIPKVGCWPEPEVPATKDMTVGALGLTDQEENELVLFLQTLTDGCTRPYTDGNTFGNGSGPKTFCTLAQTP